MASPIPAGTRVRLLHSNEEGKILKPLDDGGYLVQVEELFELPLSSAEFVILEAAAKQQAERTGPQPTTERKVTSRPKPQVQAHITPPPPEPKPEAAPLAKGYWLLLQDQTDTLKLQLCCRQQGQPWVALYAWQDGTYAPLLTTQLGTEAVPVLSLRKEELPRYSRLLLALLPDGPSAHLPQLRFLSLQLTPERTMQAPMAIQGHPAPCLPLQFLAPEQQTAPAKEARQQADTLANLALLPKPEPEIDLHIEALQPQAVSWPSHQILELQLRVARQALDAAAYHGMQQLVLIHGVGLGRLKSKLNELLGEHPYVRSFALDKSGSYGFGATLVQLASKPGA